MSLTIMAPAVETKVKTITEHANHLRKEYLHPSSQQLYIRLLKGGSLLHPITPIGEIETSSLPQRPLQAYAILEGEWTTERKKITTSVSSWSKSAAGATMRLLTSAKPEVANVLQVAFAGWGVMQETVPFTEEIIASGFADRFYGEYCRGDGMDKMAKTLIQTFAKKHQIGNQNFGMTQMESEVLLVLSGMQEWLKKFYGREDLQKAFVASVKAELAVFAKRLVHIGENVLQAKLPKRHQEVLRTLGAKDFPEKMPPKRRDNPTSTINSESAAATSTVLPSPAQTADVSSEHSPEPFVPQEEASSPLLPADPSQNTDIQKGEENDRFSVIDLIDPESLPTFLGGKPAIPSENNQMVSDEDRKAQKDTVKRDYERLEDYFAVRSSIFAASFALQSGQDIIDVDSISDKLKIGMADLLTGIRDISEHATEPLAEQSGRVDALIESSKPFLGTELLNVTTLYHNATAAIKEDTAHVLSLEFSHLENPPSLPMLEGKVRMDEEEIKEFVLTIMKAFGASGNFNHDYDQWIDEMGNLPLLGDQLYYFFHKQPALELAYKRVREEALKKLLAKFSTEGIDTGASRRRRSTKETEQDTDAFVPPLFPGEREKDTFFPL